MKNKSNYFFVNRALLHSDRWLGEKFTRGQAWVDLFGLAQHSKGFFRVRGIKIEVERGQLGYSQLTLAKRWKWSRGKVRRYLKELKNDGDIVLETRHQNLDITTVITIVKYDLWQGTRHQTEHQTGHQTDTKRDTYNKNKEEKRIKNHIYTPNFEKFWLAYPNKKEKYPAFREWQKLKPNKDLQERILESVEKYKKTKQWEEGYIKYAVRFLKNRMWEDEIEEDNSIRKLWNTIK